MTILDTLVAKPAPLREDDDDVLRVGSTRVRLDSVLGAFNAGCSAEEILLKYPSLDLTEIYGVIAYYLWQRDEVDTYLARHQALSDQAKLETEQRFPSQGVRERHLSRRSGAGTDGAAQEGRVLFTHLPL